METSWTCIEIETRQERLMSGSRRLFLLRAFAAALDEFHIFVISRNRLNASVRQDSRTTSCEIPRSRFGIATTRDKARWCRGDTTLINNSCRATTQPAVMNGFPASSTILSAPPPGARGGKGDEESRVLLTIGTVARTVALARIHDRCLGRLSAALASVYRRSQLPLSRPRPKSHDSYPRPPGSPYQSPCLMVTTSEITNSKPPRQRVRPLGRPPYLARHLSTSKFITRRCTYPRRKRTVNSAKSASMKYKTRRARESGTGVRAGEKKVKGTNMHRWRMSPEI